MSRKEIVKHRRTFIIVKSLAAIAGVALTPFGIIYMLLNFWELSVIFPSNAAYGFVAEHYSAVVISIGIALAVIPFVGIIIELRGKCGSSKYKVICAACFAVNIIGLAVSLICLSGINSAAQCFDDFG